MEKGKTTFSKINGTTFRPNGQELISKLKQGDKLLWEREPNNKYDVNAIKILNQDKEHLGYIPAPTAKDIVADMAIGKYESFIINVSEVTGGGTKHFGCNIIITPL